jgi:hypothetical protein
MALIASGLGPERTITRPDAISRAGRKAPERRTGKMNEELRAIVSLLREACELISEDVVKLIEAIDRLNALARRERDK